MDPTIVLAAVIVAVVVVIMFLRINATLVFLSLCLGAVLMQFISNDANSFIDLFNTKAGQSVSADNSTIKIFLLLLPVVLTALFMMKTVRGHGKLLLNLFPAIGVGLLGALLIVPLLPGGVSHTINGSNLWEQIKRAQDLIVGVTALICLFVLWMQRPKTGEGKKHKH
jgi:hypothetical protein